MSSAEAYATNEEVASDQPTLETRNLRKYFDANESSIRSLLPWVEDRGHPIQAVDGVSISIDPGEVYGLVGESGSGKSTLGETLLRLQEPTAGEIYYRGERVNDFSKGELRNFRKHAQLIFQDPYECLNPRHSVFQTVVDPLKNFYDYSRAELEERALEMLHDVGLRPPEEFLHAQPDQLSGGERQRVNIARALILEPDLIVADEPVSMLDLSTQSALLKLLNRLQEKLGFAMLFISHNLAIVQIVSDRIGVMYKGRIVEEGEAMEVFQNPLHPYARLLVDSVPDPSADRKRLALESAGEEFDPAAVDGCRFHPICPDRFEPCTENPPALAAVDGRDVACFLHHDEVMQ